MIIQRPHCRIFVALTCTKSHQFQCCGWQGRLSFLSHPLKCQGTELPALSDCTQSQFHQPSANLGLICSPELIPVLLQCTTKVLSSLANLLQLVFLQCFGLLFNYPTEAVVLGITPCTPLLPQIPHFDGEANSYFSTPIPSCTCKSNKLKQWKQCSGVWH